MTKKKYRILNAESSNYSEHAFNLLRSIGEVDYFQINRMGLLDCISEYDILIVRLGFQIDEEVLKFAKKLKCIVTATTGLDHIDLRLAKDYGITVLSLKGEIDFLRSIPATAELTWGLLLSLTRKIPLAFESVKDYYWDRENFRGTDLYNKKLGILGLGRIGEKIAKYGEAFGMQVKAYDVDQTKDFKGIQKATNISELFSWANIISVHVPLNEDNNELIGSNLFSLMQNGFFINTSRGEIVNEDALIQALENKNLQGAAIDVMSGERRFEIDKSPLINYARKNNNLIITPHIGGATFDSMESTEIFMAKKLIQFVSQLEKE